MVIGKGAAAVGSVDDVVFGLLAAIDCLSPGLPKRVRQDAGARPIGERPE